MGESGDSEIEGSGDRCCDQHQHGHEHGPPIPGPAWDDSHQIHTATVVGRCWRLAGTRKSRLTDCRWRGLLFLSFEHLFEDLSLRFRDSTASMSVRDHIEG